MSATTPCDRWSSIKPATRAAASADAVAAKRRRGGRAIQPPSRSSGPSFPPPRRTSNQPLHSVLADPATTNSRTAEQDWASVWGRGSTAGTAAGDSDGGVGLVPVPPRIRTTSSPHTTATDPDAARWAWPSPTTVTANSSPAAPQLDTRYSPTTPAPPTGTNQAADPWASFGTSPKPATATAPQNPPIANNQPAIGTQPPAVQSQAAQQPTRTDEVPWKPLLAVSLALAGSLGANVFLGMSYADARHRYHALVAKTTHSFQKAAGLAA